MKLTVSLYGLCYNQLPTEGHLRPLLHFNLCCNQSFIQLNLYCSLVFIARSGVTYSSFTEYYYPNASRKEPANIPVCEHQFLWLILAIFPLDFANLISEKWYLTFISSITGDCFMFLGQLYFELSQFIFL